MLIPTEKIEYNYRFKNLCGKYWEISINCINQKCHQGKTFQNFFSSIEKTLKQNRTKVGASTWGSKYPHIPPFIQKMV